MSDSIRDSDYTGTFTIEAPEGIWQAQGDTNLSLRYAEDACGIETARGRIASSPGCSQAFPSLGAPAGMLTRFVRRNRPDDPEVWAAAAGGKLYTWTKGSEAWVERAEGFLSDSWSFVNYEQARDGETEDVLLLSNSSDGTVVIHGSDLSAEKVSLAIGDDNERVRFSHLCRYAERIWGVGAPGYPDSIFYSRPYEPLDWTENAESPELGGGVIRQPTWDGQPFLALCRVGGYLTAIKKNAVFEIRGTDPSSFVITEAAGTDGAVSAGTVCSDGSAMFFLSGGGIGRYDGTRADLLSRDCLCEVMDARTGGEEEKACAVIAGHRYCLSLATDGSTENNLIIVYDLDRGSFMLHRGIGARSLYASGEKIYFTESASPWNIYRLFDPASCRNPSGAVESRWRTSWLELGKDVRKRDFTLRLTAEADRDSVPLGILLETEEGSRARLLVLRENRTDYRIRFRLRGRRVRLTLQSCGREAGFRITGGVRMEYRIAEPVRT